jgi:hypothetical protein
MKAVSVPSEHGGYLTLAGAAVTAALVSPRPWAVVAGAVALAAAFFARAPLEKLGRRGSLRPWDAPALVAYTLLALLGGGLAVAASGARGWTVGLAAGAIVAASLLARRLRSHRSATFELAGMGALGGCAGVLAWLGGAPPQLAAVVAVILAAHAASAVPLVRSELRPNERRQAARADASAFAIVGAALALLALLGAATAGIALVPRVLHLLLRRAHALAPHGAVWVGLRETATLVAAVVLLVTLS